MGQLKIVQKKRRRRITKPRSRKSHPERAIQHGYPLEPPCGMIKGEEMINGTKETDEPCPIRKTAKEAN